MSLPSNRRRDPGVLPPETILLTALIVGTIVIGGTVYLAVRLGHMIAGTADDVPTDPYDVVFGLINGRVAWPAPATSLVAVLGVLVLAGAVLLTIWWSRSASRSTRADRAAAHLGTGRDIEALTRRSVTATAQRLGVTGDAPGLPIGVMVRGSVDLLSSWEDLRTVFAGPRFGKSTSFVVPSILAAPGPVLSTSNKRDVVDATRDVRADQGTVWVFDPQQLAMEDPAWAWNPLSYVSDETRAQRLAEHFAAFAKKPDAKEDAFFTPAARTLVRGFFLAAALDGRPITQAFIWSTRPADDEPARILRRHNYPLIEAEVAGIIAYPDKQRAGVYGGAQQMLSPLTNGRLREWVEPSGNRPQFDPAAFVRSTDTLYLLSKEGADNAGPLVTALTVGVAEAAEELAINNGGRLPTPMVMELDELANVCRWSELPNLFSHYGSRGIIIDAYFQNKSQAVEIWGATGIDKLIGASNIVIYAGNIKDIDFLRQFSELIGDYDHMATSTSHGRGGHRNVSRQLVRRRIFEVSELAELPKGRAIVLAGGSRATLVRTQPWMTGPQAAAVEASIKAHDPRAVSTLEDAAHELAVVESAEASRTKEDTL